jgi:peptidyl-prolyl cis-trans isomerase C
MGKLLVLSAVGMALMAQPLLAAVGASDVAEVNGKKITKEDFDRRYKENIQNFRFSAPTKANVLNDIVNFELGVQEAKRLKLDQDASVQERMDAVLYQALVEKQLSDKFKGAVDVSEKEARDYCRRNPAVRLSHVYVALKPAALKAEEEAANKKIQQAEAALNKGENFEKVVANFSEGYSVSSGGDTGFVNKMQIDPTLYAEARKMKVGQVNKTPIRSQLGLHLVKLTGIQDCNNINVPEWQRMVFDEKRAKIFEDYLGGLRSKAKVSINNEAIKE